MSYFFSWAPRRSAGSRRADAQRRLHDAARKGKPLSPVTISGRTIARTFWGKAWCDNLERYRDFAYRLERGRSYVRSGSVIDLKVEAGAIHATVCGSSVYKVAIHIDAVRPDAWTAIQRECAGSISSRVDLLAGTFSDAVMARLCADRTGLFPTPQAIRFTCSCPDYAIMCKHVAAAMYGVGARLDHAPELLFSLRRVSGDDLVSSALVQRPATPIRSSRVLATDGLAAMFGIELADAYPAAASGASDTTGSTTKLRAKARNPASAGRGRASKSVATATALAPVTATSRRDTTTPPRASDRQKLSNGAVAIASRTNLTKPASGSARPAKPKSITIAESSDRRAATSSMAVTRISARKKTRGGAGTGTRRSKRSP